jgi:hypothetical protein
MEIADMDIEAFKTIVSATGLSGLIGWGVWKFVMRAFDTFIQQQDTINKLHQENAERVEKRAILLEAKLDDCQKKHEDVNKVIGQMREDNGVLKGKVQTLEVLSAQNNNSTKTS